MMPILLPPSLSHPSFEKCLFLNSMLMSYFVDEIRADPLHSPIRYLFDVVQAAAKCHFAFYK